MANSPIRVMAMVMRVTPMEVEFNSVNMVARSPDNRYPKTNSTTPGIPNKRRGAWIPASNRRVEQTETPSRAIAVEGVESAHPF